MRPMRPQAVLGICISLDIALSISTSKISLAPVSAGTSTLRKVSNLTKLLILTMRDKKWLESS
jgi:hypothetical protein